jgi:signal transduction histidine kinase
MVDDDGPGIPETKREEVFLPLRRLHSWWDVPGTGLGLAACRRSIIQHGGRIWIESAPGGGTRFIFTLLVIPE